MSDDPFSIQQSLSPALLADGGAPCYELKFLLDPALDVDVRAWAATGLAPDPHGDPALGGAYSVTTLLLDTPEHDVYHRSAGYRRNKYRIRRYGDGAGLVYLEQKRRAGDEVRKHRTPIPDAELDCVARPLSLESWPGRWFAARVHAKRLVPTCLIRYVRSAFTGAGSSTPMRLTLDRLIHGRPWSTWRVVPFDGGLPLSSHRTVLELKFTGSMPAPFKSLVRQFRLIPAAVSKYRLFRDACPAGGARPESASA